MKITIGLSNKLKEEFNAQTENLLRPLRIEREQIIEKTTEKNIQEIIEAITKYPTIENFIKRKAFRFDTTIMEASIKANMCDFINAETTKDIDEQISTIRNKRRKEFEVIMIELTYGKDISDIKTIFEKYKLNF